MNESQFEDCQHEISFSKPVTRRKFLSTGLKVSAAAFSTTLVPNIMTPANCGFNVLFIMADDLRPLLGCYGHPEIHTPNIDSLAKRGTIFNNAYCQYPLCNPSRVSMMTGLRPETTGVYGNSTGWRAAIPEGMTLPQHFKTHGYHTRSVGKIAHADRWLDTLSWSAPIWSQSMRIDRSKIPSWQVLDIAEKTLLDGRIASESIDILTKVKNQLFFLAIGFHKPHLPYNVPRKFYELYDIETFNSISSINPPSENDLRSYADIPKENIPISKEKTLELMHGYAASISYMDSQIGRILQHLDILDISQKTVVVFTSDHGYHLGEYENWGKSTLFDVALRTPLIVSVPGQVSGISDALVELVDIYPTLCEVCLIPTPTQLEGVSFMPLIEDPMHSWKPAVFSQSGGRNRYRKRFSIRTSRYRYTEFENQGTHRNELFDLDMAIGESDNIANHPENKELVAKLSEQLHAGWREALPDVLERSIIQMPLPWDVNNDGIVNIEDLMLVSKVIEEDTPEYPKADVNKDGKVDLIDLLLVASHLGESCYASAPKFNLTISHQHTDTILQWLIEAYQKDDGSDLFRDAIANLENLINIQGPSNTTLLPNYPNPFNPETWIPYDLSQNSMVKIHIYNQKGQTVRVLNLGFQNAGTYRTKHKAAFWDGRNSYGELVASGSYYYSLTAGKKKAIRKMLIRK